jgi:heparan-alpha-glucosaminide N-acetyltransferase
MSDAPQSSLPERIASIDAYRGFVMLLMMAEVLELSKVAENAPHNALIGFLAHHQTHVEWVGCTLHDLIQPSFSFLVGVALPFSLASRTAKGMSRAQLIRHAFGRALILILLGIFLRSIGRPQTYFTFEDTLTQIGLGYGFLFLAGWTSRRAQWIALAVILVGYWALFAFTPLPPPGFDTQSLGVPPDWSHNLTGFAAHWNKNTNSAMYFDQWFLNLFPREKPFHYNGGGYATLSFIPTLGTMILGLIAGGMLRDDRTPREQVRWFVLAGLGFLVSGAILGWLGICPVVKRIWTPSWTLFSGGWCFLLLAGFYALVDIGGKRRVMFPLIVVGMNSIAAYCLAHLFTSLISEALPRHLGHGIFEVLGKAYEPLLHGAATLFVLWLILWWMYRRKLFLKI